MTTMMKHLTTTLLLLICFDNPAEASMSASLSCRKKDKIAISQQVATNGVNWDIKLNITTEKGLTHIAREDYDTYLFQDLGMGVFTVVSKKRGASEESSIYAIPKTVRVKRKANVVQAKFDAVLNISIPTVKIIEKDIQVACTYNYNH
jgi:hypothetical protein